MVTCDWDRGADITCHNISVHDNSNNNKAKASLDLHISGCVCSQEKLQMKQ